MALAACGATAYPERLHAAMEAYDGFTHSLTAIFDPTMVTEVDDTRVLVG